MAVDFYRKNKRRGKALATMGYGKVMHIRCIFQSFWNPEFALAYYAWADLKWSDADPPFPDSMLELFRQCDCKGELSNGEIKAIVEELEKNETFMQRKPIPLKRLKRRCGEDFWENTWMNDEGWRDEVQEFYEMLKGCAKRGCGIEWF